MLTDRSSLLYTIRLSSALVEGDRDADTFTAYLPEVAAHALPKQVRSSSNDSLRP